MWNVVGFERRLIPLMIPIRNFVSSFKFVLKLREYDTHVARSRLQYVDVA